jgi:hypothetical protein
MSGFSFCFKNSITYEINCNATNIGNAKRKISIIKKASIGTKKNVKIPSSAAL